MSEQEFQRTADNQQATEHEDPLAELARIVSGRDTETDNQQYTAQPVGKTVTGQKPTDVGVADVLSEILEPANRPPANPEPAKIDIYGDSMDLEAQLLAELGGDAPQPAVVPSTNVPVVDAPTFEASLADIVEPSAELMPEETSTGGQDLQSSADPAPTVLDSATEKVDAPENQNAASVMPESGLPDIDEMDFSEAFDSEFEADDAPEATAPQMQVSPSPLDHEPATNAQGDVLPNLVSSNSDTQTFVDTSEVHENSVERIDDGHSDPKLSENEFQFQAAPDFQNPERQIDLGVSEIQNALANDTDIDVEIEDAFTSAFADEFALDAEMAIDQVDPNLGSANVQMNEIAHEFNQSEIEVADPSAIPAAIAPQSSAPSTDGQLPLEDQDFDGLETNVIIEPSRINTHKRMAGLALGLALLAGGGAFAYNYFDTQQTSPPQLVRADTSDFKVKPEKPGGKEIANQDQPVYDQVAGTTPDVMTQDALIASGEEPVDIVAPVGNEANVMPAKSVKSSVRLSAGDETTNGATDIIDPNAPNNNAPTTAMQPRKVKTVSVRADGTIVSTTPPTTTAAVEVAANTTPAVDQADAVTTQNPVIAPLPDVNSIDGASTTGQIAVPSANPNSGATTSTLALVKPVAVKPVVVTTRALSTAKKVVPVAPVVAVPVVAPVATAAPKPVKIAKATTTNIAGDGYAVQISSQRSKEAAQATYQNLKRRFGSLLNGQPNEIREAKLTGKGTFYRVRILQNSKTAALDFCTRFKSVGGSCFVTK